MTGAVSVAVGDVLVFPDGPSKVVTEDDPVVLKIVADEEALVVTVRLNLDPPAQEMKMAGPISGSYTILLDESVLTQFFYTGPTDTIEQLIPLSTMQNGEHSLQLTVQDFQGKKHERKKEFVFDAAPKISVRNLGGEDDQLNMMVELSLVGRDRERLGVLEMYLDEKPLHLSEITRKNYRKSAPLSSYLDKPLFPADLMPGTHLLKLMVHGINGSRSERNVSFDVPAKKAEVNVQRDKSGKLERIVIDFPGSSQAVIGSAAVHYNHSVIFFTQTDHSRLEITSENLMQAFDKHKITFDNDTPIPLILNTRTANFVESWVEIQFR